jgi:hypothetical protein
MADLGDLAKEFNRLAAELPQALSKATAQIASSMVSDLAHNTPVDTSQALSSWIVSFDSPSSIVGKPWFPGHHGSTQSQSAAATVDEANRILADKRPGQTIYITNNQPYIQALDDGTISKQPGNFVALAMARARLKVAKLTLNW